MEGGSQVECDGGMAFRPSGKAPFTAQKDRIKGVNASFSDGLKAIPPLMRHLRFKTGYFPCNFFPASRAALISAWFFSISFFCSWMYLRASAGAI
jgi:hypothetical protein